ncbi:MAG: glycosyltransferase family 4 protein [Chloroflexota bacterium]
MIKNKMKVLFITAYYTPCHLGWGYMRLCEQVADGLYERGHQVAVLTSQYVDGDEVKPYPVHRDLIIDPDWNVSTSAMQQFFVGRRDRENQAVKRLQEINDPFQPDIIFIWHGHGLPRKVFQVAENWGKAVYYFANYLPEMPDEYELYWRSFPNKGLNSFVKRMLAPIALRQLAQEGKPVPLQYTNVVTVSQYVRDRLVNDQLIPPTAVSIPNGIDVDMFWGDVRQVDLEKRPLRCLTAGRLDPTKGFHTVVEALALLQKEMPLDQLECTIMGGGMASYKEQLVQQVAAAGLQRVIKFRDPVSITEWANVLDEYDVFILPSEWSEPLASVMLEAMSKGMLMIGTPIGGSGEVLRHLETGLAFTPGDSQELAEQFKLILNDLNLVTTLAEKGQSFVRQAYNINHIVDRIEAYLQNRIGLRLMETEGQ